MSEARLRETFQTVDDAVAETVFGILSHFWRAASWVEAEIIAAVEAGDRVTLGQSVEPACARGEPATVTKVTATLLRVRLDRPVGPFATTDLAVIPLEIRPLRPVRTYGEDWQE